MTKAFVELKDELHQKKARLNFLLKALAELTTDSSCEEAWSTGWEIYQGVEMAQEILNRMMERIDETLNPLLRQTR